MLRRRAIQRRQWRSPSTLLRDQGRENFGGEVLRFGALAPCEQSLCLSKLVPGPRLFLGVIKSVSRWLISTEWTYSSLDVEHSVHVVHVVQIDL